MTMEQTVQFVTVFVAVVAALDIRRMVKRVTVRVDVFLVFTIGLLGVSWLAWKGPLVIGGIEVSASNIATFNRAFVAAVLVAIAVNLHARHRESRLVRGIRET